MLVAPSSDGPRPHSVDAAAGGHLCAQGAGTAILSAEPVATTILEVAVRPVAESSGVDQLRWGDPLHGRHRPPQFDSGHQKAHRFRSSRSRCLGGPGAGRSHRVCSSTRAHESYEACCLPDVKAVTSATNHLNSEWTSSPLRRERMSCARALAMTAAEQSGDRGADSGEPSNGRLCPLHPSWSRARRRVYSASGPVSRP